MSNRTTIITGLLSAALLVGCSTESTTPTARMHVSDASTSASRTPHLGAGDSLGQEIFTRDRVNGGSTASNAD